MGGTACRVLSRSPASQTGRGTGEETLEKVVRLLDLLAEINRHPFLSHVLVLKGGTALNLGFGNPRRLSVDLDFNYIGALARTDMERDRPQTQDAVARIAGAQRMVSIILGLRSWIWSTEVPGKPERSGRIKR